MYCADISATGPNKGLGCVNRKRATRTNADQSEEVRQVCICRLVIYIATTTSGLHEYTTTIVCALRDVGSRNPMARIESAEVGIEIAYGVWSGHGVVVGGVLWGVGGERGARANSPNLPGPPSLSACDKISQFTCTTPSQITKFRTQTYCGRG